ncbi:FmdB family transcriptional regulator [Cryobacterium sp. TMT2-18-3]|uniref:FmdB family zinc ribbon protein n=1 Tax=unclassified Cryobacterium TaxID=2649013 RepID=UPI001069ADE2|nr:MULTISPECIES: FmdB family zinc ribbon protein [unclassified Cryobacterium]TFC26445.1 FmdB family transcriptional regulator [Cryobacterium sp. TMT2-18-2]TFC37610.1 FmdB family transcriptional regulator [Cryobacterium sp. TMT2-42-4]TFC64377.1 FmdB family transcriptional regulator [Cryobacterium sp. TMT2-18-3]
MPTYSYRCTECDTAFDIQQAFTDNSLTTCPTCAGKLRKVFSSIGVTFSGSGFYSNDARSDAKRSLERSSKTPDKKSDKSSDAKSGDSGTGSGSSSEKSAAPARDSSGPRKVASTSTSNTPAPAPAAKAS